MIEELFSRTVTPQPRQLRQWPRQYDRDLRITSSLGDDPWEVGVDEESRIFVRNRAEGDFCIEAASAVDLPSDGTLPAATSLRRLRRVRKSGAIGAESGCGRMAA